ncbi:TPA: phenylacetate-CoA oxygenase/reductase subunit PaaK [Corynebacterium striatum]|uniref:Phenylacetate-CoA oxygenase/reductase subunit PaaK n=1 Tax=Corynebacterium striatum TaxID=43770 RepID=A0ABC8CLF7_CORST|nr:1,2-phenylacetyl-CoA epoxidase subunit PaaE [Corynebacterium striatum]ATZ08899.1 phenylacetate-CoA oxygenase/reductase subunit PaaK [Corynebacterium striatum]EGT5575995.1 phenylacetate-CoA oxygenase/reductase subunit PaaK [Corynebacterium striatum]EGT5594760.1 phenylacetate-CoA oxygenase/reductase subunit PaaK [Corynebacterium striatum]EGT5612883.1 phenylacetate-CoA oxygenase/reductase subunit PaaK [Corynebacterium striatum]EGT5788082.1 phenylacetate-CoA oxygenase/reductase subunit PaaK [Co
MTTTIPNKKKATFNSLVVSEVRKLTEDSVEVSFAVPAQLQADYDYIPGQYVALRADIDGQEIRRSYSICDVPRDGVIRVAIKRDRGGVFSTWANESLQPGFKMDVMNPQGAFTSKTHVTGLNNPEAVREELEKLDHPHLVAIAAGSGITPIMAIAQTVLSESPDTTFELIFANKGGGDVMFAEEIGDLKDKYPNRFAVHHVLSREQRVNPLFSGRIDAEKLQTLLDNVVRTESVDEWFLCGPFELVQLVRDELSGRSIDEKNVRYELFTTGKPTGDQNQTGRLVEVDPEGDNVEINFQLDGLSGSVSSPVSANESLLNAALRVRSDVPFACAGGVCGTCRAKVVEGEVEMDENYALEADEVAAGYILTCQSHAKTPNVTIDFDA